MSQQERPAGSETEVVAATTPTSQSQVSEGEGKRDKEKESGQLRPDPAFKEYTAEQARKAGLELRNVELPQLSLSDLVLAVPPNTDLNGTMFDFFGKVNVVEFKSQNDDFDLRALFMNQGRAAFMFAKGEVPELEDLMSVFVSAYYPETVVKFLESKGTNYRAEHAWLIRCQLGGIEVAIVVCRLLPIECRYYWWLIFAPTTSPEWKKFVTRMLEQGEREIVDQIIRLRPKEYKKVAINFVEELKKRSPEEQAEYKKDRKEILEFELEAFRDLYPQDVAEVAAKLEPQTLVAGLTPEKIARLSPEQRQKLLELLSQAENQTGEGNS